jgi:hypothetical protein
VPAAAPEPEYLRVSVPPLSIYVDFMVQSYEKFD